MQYFAILLQYLEKYCRYITLYNISIINSVSLIAKILLLSMTHEKLMMMKKH